MDIGHIDSEYSSLRTELVENANRINDLTKFSVLVTAALLGYAIGDSCPSPSTESSDCSGLAWLIALLPMLVVAPTAVLSLNHKFQIVRIASYIRVRFAETHPYELDLWNFRNREWAPGEAKVLKHPRFEIGTWGTVAVVGVFCIASSLLLPGRETPNLLGFSIRCWVICVFAVGWLAFTMWVIVQSREMQMGKACNAKMIDFWNKVLDKAPAGENDRET